MKTCQGPIKLLLSTKRKSRSNLPPKIRLRSNTTSKTSWNSSEGWPSNALIWLRAYQRALKNVWSVTTRYIRGAPFGIATSVGNLSTWVASRSGSRNSTETMMRRRKWWCRNPPTTLPALTITEEGEEPVAETVIIISMKRQKRLRRLKLQRRSLLFTAGHALIVTIATPKTLCLSTIASAVSLTSPSTRLWRFHIRAVSIASARSTITAPTLGVTCSATRAAAPRATSRCRSSASAPSRPNECPAQSHPGVSTPAKAPAAGYSTAWYTSAKTNATRGHAISAMMTLPLSASARRKRDKLSVGARNLFATTSATSN